MEQTNLLKWNASHGFRFTHDWFRFPGKFHPPLVEHILRSVKPTGVVDPMAGVGTVAVEAKAAGIPSLSLEIDPISSFFIRVKTSPISTSTLTAAWKNLSSSLDRFRRSDKEIEIRMFRDIRVDRMREGLAALKATELERLTYWFRRYVLLDYARIDHAIWNGGLPNRSNQVRRFFLACLISSIRRISFADPSPVSGLEITKHMKGKIEDGYDIDVFGQFKRRVDLAIKRMDEYTRYLNKNGNYRTPCYSEQVDCRDLRTLPRPRGFKPNLIFFSPPYCNAIEYWRRHRLEFFLSRFLDEQGVIALHRRSVGRTTAGQLVTEVPRLGYPPTDRVLSVLGEEGRHHKGRILWQYFDDMKQRLKIFRDYLPKNGHCILVVGDSETRGRKIPTVKTIAWLAQELGFEYVKTSNYKIKNRAMQFPVKTNCKIERETIIVLKKS